MIRVLVAEDMRILRDTLVSVLNLEDDIKVRVRRLSGDWCGAAIGDPYQPEPARREGQPPSFWPRSAFSSATRLPGGTWCGSRWTPWWAGC
jgi:hypothetical protein